MENEKDISHVRDFVSASEPFTAAETYQSQDPAGLPESAPLPGEQRPENRLKNELSPYLLQHAENPVGWYPWGAEAFDAARREDKPVFLSIGYSSCHWCHVMERECFNDPEVAELMNDTCIPVKVDREERPDIDALFMDICHIQNGSGGWPLNVFLTPGGVPFFAATWLPKRTSGQMPGMTDILPRVKWLWLMQREDVIRGAESLADALRDRLRLVPGGHIGSAAARSAFETLRATFDPQWGGFGKAPKFPCVPRLIFLLRQARNPANPEPEREEAFAMADLTLRRMWRGGIHDHLGGGFSRYSTDARWIAPHFEKLLCDQAMLLLTAALAQEVKPDPFFRLMAEDIVRCVTRDFLDPSSGFRTALDADSREGEGRYYLWTEEEIRALLPDGDAGLFCAAYAVMPGGNFAHEMAGSLIGSNVLYEASTVTELVRRYGLRGPEIAQRLAQDREILLEARNRRTPPLCDDKILMDWNGLMIGALARASAAFEVPDWRLTAEKAALFLQKTLVDPKGAWRRRIRHGEAGIPALAGDYAALLWGVTELYRAAALAEVSRKQQKDWLRCAEDLAKQMIENFWDESQGGLFLSPADDPNIFLRRKSALDDALPSANALAALALARLGAETGEKQFLERAKAILHCFARSASLSPVDHISLLTAAPLVKAARPHEEPAKEEPKPEEAVPEEAVSGAEEPSPEEEEAPGERRHRTRGSRRERRYSRGRRTRPRDR